MMERPLDTRLTPELAREVCQRMNSTVEIDGSIGSLGNQYVLGLNALNCRTGETLAQEQVTADGKKKCFPLLAAPPRSCVRSWANRKRHLQNLMYRLRKPRPLRSKR